MIERQVVARDDLALRFEIVSGERSCQVAEVAFEAGG